MPRKKLKTTLKTFKLNEDTISMVLGAIVVVVVGILIFNYFKNINQGRVTDSAATETQTVTDNKPAEIVEKDGQQFAKGLPTTYKVQKGDHLWKISEKFYNSGYNWIDIAKVNKLKNPGVIVADQELTIPDVAVKSLTAKTVVAKTAITKAVVGPSIEGATYKTVKGDYLWNIAIRAYGDGYAWTKIYTANKKLIGANPSRLFTDVELTLPR